MKRSREVQPASPSALSSRTMEDSPGFASIDEGSVAARTKIGRNDPCPCGSGKKYKKFCLGTTGDGNPDRSPESEGIGPDGVSNPAGTAGIRIALYTFTKLLDDPDSVMRLSGCSRESIANRWTPRKMAALSTEATEEGLRSRGIAYSRQAFVSTSRLSFRRTRSGREPRPPRSCPIRGVGNRSRPDSGLAGNRWRSDGCRRRGEWGHPLQRA